MLTQTIICIPGLWTSRAEIVSCIASQSEGLFLLPLRADGDVLVETASQRRYDLEIYDFDPQLADSFAIAGRSWIQPSDLDAIAAHKHTLYVLSADVSVETAQHMLRVGHSLLKAGGLAVKVESAGIAHSATQWAEFAVSEDLSRLYRAFVTLLKGPTYSYSCGMHNLGLPDSSAPLALGPEAAIELLDSFNLYQLLERPILKPSNTFSIAAGKLRYQLRKGVCTGHPADDPFHNPFGIWHHS
jgi:hypothetical protein